MNYTIRWRHPILDAITETACERHQRMVIPALDTVGIVYGLEQAPEDADCTRCGWDSRYGADGTPPVMVRMHLEALVLAEIAAFLGAPTPPEAPRRSA